MRAVSESQHCGKKVPRPLEWLQQDNALRLIYEELSHMTGVFGDKIHLPDTGVVGICTLPDS